MRRLLVSLAAALAFAGVASPSVTAAPAAVSAVYVAAYDKNNVIYYLNSVRAQYGLPALRYDWRLQYAAQLHSNDQAAQGRMTHVGSDGSHGGERITRAGLRWNSWGEAVAAGQTSATQVVNAWMASPAHRPYLLNRGYTMVGVGLTVRAGIWYWTLDMAS